jgi:hypothetical protein
LVVVEVGVVEVEVDHLDLVVVVVVVGVVGVEGIRHNMEEEVILHRQIHMALQELLDQESLHLLILLEHIILHIVKCSHIRSSIMEEEVEAEEVYLNHPVMADMHHLEVTWPHGLHITQPCRFITQGSH